MRFFDLALAVIAVGVIAVPLGMAIFFLLYNLLEKWRRGR